MPANAIQDLIPHRGAMALLDQLIEVSAHHAKASVKIEPYSSFFVAERGVPAWIGLEYLGQTAALIAGQQLKQGLVEPHLGLLVGSRQYRCEHPWFTSGTQLLIHCWEHATVGNELATFNGEILSQDEQAVLASGRITVYRQPLAQPG